MERDLYQETKIEVWHFNAPMQASSTMPQGPSGGSKSLQLSVRIVGFHSGAEEETGNKWQEVGSPRFLSTLWKLI